MDICFIYDLERDARNIWLATQLAPSHSVSCGLLSPSIRAQADKSWEYSSPYIRQDLHIFQERYKCTIQRVRGFYEATWQEESHWITLILDDIFGTPFPFSRVVAGLTLCNRCPYDPVEGSFMVSVLASPMDMAYILAHELFHLQFWSVSQDQIKNLDRNVAEEFAENMTAILDAEFAKKFPIPADRNEPQSKIRQIISKKWATSRDLRATARYLASLANFCQQTHGAVVSNI